MNHSDLQSKTEGRKPGLLKEDTVTRIQQLITEQDLKPGDQLPAERELSKNLGVSRVTAREALNLLEQWGILKKKLGAGTFLTEMPKSVVADSIERFFILKNCTYEDLMSFREVLEPEMAALAAARATPQHLLNLQRAIEGMEKEFRNGNPDRYAEFDARFHEELANASGNHLMVAIVSGLHQLMHNWLLDVGLGIDSSQYQSGKKLKLMSMSEQNAIQGILNHRQIYDAVGARKPWMARKAMKIHMRLSREALARTQNKFASKGGGDNKLKINAPVKAREAIAP